MSHSTRTETPVGPRLLWAAVATGAVLALTLAPRSLVAPARGAFMRIVDVLAGPVVAGMSYDELESILNALLFVPLGAALALLLGRRLWVLAPLLGFGLSFAVEYAQTRIPGRVPDIHDIVWNSVGALAGAVVAALLRLASRSRRAQRAG
jgi:VanZ family protein